MNIKKSTIIAGLTQQTNLAKIICNEDGGYDDLNTGTKVAQVDNYKEFMMACKFYKTQEHPFIFLAIDGLTMFQSWAMHQGTLLCMKSPIGQKLNRVGGISGGQLMSVDDPGWLDATESIGQYSWGFQRKVMVKLFLDDLIMKMPKNMRIILIAHTKEKVVEGDLSGQIGKRQIGVVGKNAEIIAGRVGAIGMLKRVKDEGFLIFKAASSEASMGSRFAYLAGKKIKISQKNEDDSVTTFWENIYPHTFANLK